jgi:hypothetical protein
MSDEDMQQYMKQINALEGEIVHTAAGSDDVRNGVVSGGVRGLQCP